MNIKVHIKSALYQVNNFWLATKIISNSIYKNITLFKVGNSITILKWINIEDNSWVGKRLIIKRVCFPFIYVEDDYTREGIISEPIVLDVREICIRRY